MEASPPHTTQTIQEPAELLLANAARILAYGIYSFHSFYRDAGVFGVYVGTRPATADLARDTVIEELARVASEGLEPGEFSQVREQVQGQLVLTLESTGAKLYRLAGYALRDESIRPVDAILADLAAVTPERVAEVASKYVGPDRHYLLSLGPSN